MTPLDPNINFSKMIKGSLKRAREDSIILTCADGAELPISKELAQSCNTLRNLLEDSDDERIPMPPEIRSEHLMEFIDILGCPNNLDKYSDDDLTEFILLANYLDVPILDKLFEIWLKITRTFMTKFSEMKRFGNVVLSLKIPKDLVRMYVIPKFKEKDLLILRNMCPPWDELITKTLVSLALTQLPSISSMKDDDIIDAHMYYKEHVGSLFRDRNTTKSWAKSFYGLTDGEVNSLKLDDKYPHVSVLLASLKKYGSINAIKERAKKKKKRGMTCRNEIDILLKPFGFRTSVRYLSNWSQWSKGYGGSVIVDCIEFENLLTEYTDLAYQFMEKKEWDNLYKISTIEAFKKIVVTLS